MFAVAPLTRTRLPDIAVEPGSVVAEGVNKRRALGSGLPKIAGNDKLIHLKDKMG
jgi:hypothetical protein